jgi:hypothetical protein
MSNSKGSKVKCKCGLRRRGSNHKDGAHHKARYDDERGVAINRK